MSDHGFAAFDRAVNLNTWLEREGFLAMDGESMNWPKTRAYAVGLNALYVNLAGREEHGIVQPGAEQAALLTDIKRRLSEFRDPETGGQVVLDVSEVRKSTSRFAPDLIVGYAPPYRGSWETALGRAPVGIIQDNHDAWIGDHCMAAAAVPGTLIGTHKLLLADPRLKDLPVTILNEFGIEPGPRMTGRVVY
jgi:predicted AlkP superfamily phosphohydrolase/phosphomutase